jgi:ABC-2 type transport system ATP-binding protein
MIQIKDLIKNFENVRALDNLNITIPGNKIFGLIGPDGAGKTTLIRILSGIMSITSGEIIVGGKSIKKHSEEIKLLIGYMPQKFSLYGDLSVIENLNFYADLYLVSKAERKEIIRRLIDFSNLGSFQNRLAEKLSGGMKQKLGLACCLIHKPEILLLDEPTNGVDPLSRREFWDILMELKSQGVTIIISTPYMDEAAKCDIIALIDKGKLIFTGMHQEIIQKYEGKIIEIITSDNELSYEILLKINKIRDVIIFGELLHINMDEKLEEKIIIEKLKESKIEILSYNRTTPRIEDVFIYLTEVQKKIKNEQHN